MIETKRLFFRRYTQNDIELLFGMTSDPNMMRYIRHGKPWTKEETLQSLERYISWNEKEMGLYLAFSKDDGKMMGHSGLIPQDIEGKNEVEVGYWVVKDFWGKGYGYEQASAWKDYGLNLMKQRRLISLIQHQNIGSIKVAQKNGMKYEKDIDLNGKCAAVYSIEVSE
ncbi:MAG: GNAT family N-acetyltransferase [Clostridia bacterium]|nr:GNAT family N-acetyltransferase [Clostridia bacterium]